MRFLYNFYSHLEAQNVSIALDHKLHDLVYSLLKLRKKKEYEYHNRVAGQSGSSGTFEQWKTIKVLVCNSYIIVVTSREQFLQVSFE